MITISNVLRASVKVSSVSVRYLGMSSNNKYTVGVCQMTATNDLTENFRICSDLIQSAKSQQAKMVFLPEACDYIATNQKESIALAEPLSGPLVQKFCKLAKENEIWISLGGIHEKVSEDKVCMTHVIIDETGEIKGLYRKLHLFDVHIPEKNVTLRESDTVLKGERIVPPIQTPVGKLGLAICYDMRFPELSCILAKMGAEIITFPSAFTYVTGEAHWEVLLRARAIETQTYVIAAAQCGRHNSKRRSWGHAMIVDPWGTIKAECTLEQPSCEVFQLEPERIREIRASMPVYDHRRYDLYPKLLPNWSIVEPDKDVYQFGQTYVDARQVFLQSHYSIAFTNIKCVVPGHVLVIPIRCVERMCDLTSMEIKDLFTSVQHVQSLIENKYGCKSSTMTIQDGVDAGQTVMHVHVHILPRKPGDFTHNDLIYSAIEKDKSSIRTDIEMFDEALELRSFFYKL